MIKESSVLARLWATRPRRRIPVVHQTTHTDCGAACLAMVLAFYGRPRSLAEVREVVGIGRDGARAQDLLEAAGVFGLRGRGVQLEELDDLYHLERGAVLHWDFGHYVVFEEWGDRGLRMIDPAGGRLLVSRKEADRFVTGIALIFEPPLTAETPQIGEGKESAPGTRPWGRFERFLKPLFQQKSLLARVLVLSVLLQLLSLALPILTGLLVDRVVPDRDWDLLWILCLGSGSMVVFLFATSCIRSFLLLQLRAHLDRRITWEFLDHLLALPFAFFQHRSTGDLMMRLNSNAMLRQIFTSTTLSTVLDGALVISYLVALATLNLKLGVVVLGLGLLRLVLFMATRSRRRDLLAAGLQAQTRSRSYQVQMLSGIQTLKSLAAEDRATERWSHLFTEEINTSVALGRLTAVFDGASAALEMASPLVILAVGGVQVLEGEISLGTMLAMSALSAGFLAPLKTLVNTAVGFQQAGTYLERIHDVLDHPVEQSPSANGPAPALTGRLALEEVSFRYGPADPEVVKEVTVEIAPGSFVAVVGPSGAGKTSLAQVLVGLYPPTSGKVLFDGLNLRSLDLKSVRRQIGIVAQEPFLFNASIRHNIALVDPTLPLARVQEAARSACIDDDVMAQPMGYNTILADGGGGLSGGQRQRLALARALIRRPPILVLDEATSHLDTRTEEAVHRRLAALRCTRVVIAHRLSTVRQADLILVLDRGRLVDSGKHEELMARDGVYRRLVAAQEEMSEGRDGLHG